MVPWISSANRCFPLPNKGYKINAHTHRLSNSSIPGRSTEPCPRSRFERTAPSSGSKVLLPTLQALANCLASCEVMPWQSKKKVFTVPEYLVIQTLARMVFGLLEYVHFDQKTWYALESINRRLTYSPNCSRLDAHQHKYNSTFEHIHDTELHPLDRRMTKEPGSSKWPIKKATCQPLTYLELH